MRILFIQNLYVKNPAGGAGLLCQDIFTALEAQGHECLMLTSNSWPENEKVMGLLGINPSPHKDPKEYDLRDKVGWLLRSRRNYFVVKKVIDDFSPEVIYLHNLELITTSPLRAAIDCGKRVVVHAHNEQYGAVWRTLKNRKTETLKSRIFKLKPHMNGVHVIAISKYIADSLLKEGFPPERVHLIYNGLPARLMADDINSPRERKAVFVGTISRHKGVHIAIEAIGILKKKGLCLPLEIIGKVGTEDYLTELRTLSKQLDVNGEVNFVDPLKREDILKKLRTVDLFLYPSLWEEPFGLVGAEAMAAGAIVIGSDRGAIPEVIGEAGVVVEAKPEQFAEAIKTAINMTAGEKETLRLKALRRVQELFSLEKNIGQIEELLSNC